MYTHKGQAEHFKAVSYLTTRALYLLVSFCHLNLINIDTDLYKQDQHFKVSEAEKVWIFSVIKISVTEDINHIAE